MFRNNKEMETAVHVLAVHLDGLLDIADVLLSSNFIPKCLSDRAETAEILRYNTVLRGFVEELRTLELALLTKLHQARQWCQHLAKLDKKSRCSSRLFMAGTQTLCDVMLKTADRSAQTFDDGDQVLCYLKDRCLLATDVLSVDDIKRVEVNENFLLCGWVPIHVFLNSLEAYLTALDLEYRLYAPHEIENVSVSNVGSSTIRETTASVGLRSEIAGDFRPSLAPAPLKQSKVPTAPANVKNARPVACINQVARSRSVVRPPSNVPKKSANVTEVNDVAVIELSPTEPTIEIRNQQRMVEGAVQLKTGKLEDNIETAKKRSRQELPLERTDRTASGTSAIVPKGASTKEHGRPAAENTAQESQIGEFDRPGPTRLTSALAAVKTVERKDDREPDLLSDVGKKRDDRDLAAPMPVMVTGRPR